MSEGKAVPPIELSLKYMAWNIKEMAEEAKKQTQCLNNILMACGARSVDSKLSSNSEAQPNLPF